MNKKFRENLHISMFCVIHSYWTVQQMMAQHFFETLVAYLFNRCVQKKSFPEELSIYEHLFENIKPGTELPPPSLCFKINPYLLMESK